MVKVLIEVRSGAARFSIAVQAESIERAVCLVGGRYRGGEVRAKVSDDYEASYLEDLVAGVEMDGSGPQTWMAA